MRGVVEKTKCYRETFNAVFAEHGTNASKVCQAVNKSTTWLAKKMEVGYAMFSTMELIAIANVVGCRVDDLSAIPTKASRPTERTTAAAAGLTKEQMDEVLSLIADGFKMLHTDVRNAIETMDKYWKPEPPKYNVKDIEKP